jgi:hypothetical protein
MINFQNRATNSVRKLMRRLLTVPAFGYTCGMVGDNLRKEMVQTCQSGGAGCDKKEEYRRRSHLDSAEHED